MNRTFKCLPALTLALILTVPATAAEEAAPAIKTLRAVGAEGTGNVAAAEATRSLIAIGRPALLDVLRAFDGAGPLAANWLRGAAEGIADSADSLPKAELEAFIKDRGHDPRARRLAFELLVDDDSAAREPLVVGMLDDPSPTLRRDAVALYIARGETQIKAGQADQGVQSLKQALSGATDKDQVEAIAKTLRDQKVDVDLSRHYGFLSGWQIIGPFNNREGVGFDTVYPPEEKVDLAGKYQGQLGEVSWKPYSTDDEFGVFDVAKQIENYKGSVMYAVADYTSGSARDAEIRLGTPNSWKIWVNGKPIFGREEYHRGMKLDQYRVPVRLQAGRNQILLKLCQNEQKDSWAQRYQFQLRVCDASGRAIAAANTKSGNKGGAE